MDDRINSDDLVLIDSFPLPLCQPVRNHRVSIFQRVADIGYNASKQVWFYGFTVYMLVTLSGYILNDVVTSASVHNLIVGCQQSIILADLGYLSHELKADLAKERYGGL